jgi:hypothetical protein
MPEAPKKTPDQLFREAVNAKGLQIVKDGFDAIDELAEIAKHKLKRKLLSLLIPKKRPAR